MIVKTDSKFTADAVFSSSLFCEQMKNMPTEKVNEACIKFYASLNELLSYGVVIIMTGKNACDEQETIALNQDSDTRKDIDLMYPLGFEKLSAGQVIRMYGDNSAVSQ